MRRERITNIRAALFDLDGTLFDSVGMWHEIDEIFLRKRGLAPTAEYKKNIVALGFTATAYYTIEYYGLRDTPEQLMDEWSLLARDAYAHTVGLLRGAKEYLDECEKNGLKLAAVTSLCKEFACSGLKNNGIADKFSHVFTADEVGLAKTSPDIFLHAAKTLGVPPASCIVFDDASAAIASAKKAGMKSVGITGPMFSAADFMPYADYIIPSLEQAPILTLK